MNNKLKIEIIGKNPMYIIKELIRKKINIYFLEKNSQGIQIIIDEKDYEIIKKIKTTYQIEIIKRYGINNLYFFLRKNKLLIFFFSIGIIIITILSNMVLQIEVIHPNKNIRTIVKKDLENLGLQRFHFKINYKMKEKIKKQILVKEKQKLEWLEIDEKGTKYIIRVEERKLPKKERICQPRTIIAKKNAIITEITASKGEITKKKNDYVEKGDILINGLIHNKEKVTSKTCATGEVFGETWYTIKISMPIKHKIIKSTKENSWGFYYYFLNKEKNYGNKFSTLKKYEYNIIDSKLLAFKFGLANYNKTEEKLVKYNDSEITNIATTIASKKMKKRLSNDEEIITKKVLKKELKNSKIKVEIFFKVKENITSYLDISDINIEEENQRKR